MDENDSRRSDRRQDQGSFKSTLVARFLTPIAAAAASAAAGYAAKKAPDFVERKLLPRLRSLAGDAGGATRDLPARAASVASSAGDMAQELGDKAKSLVTSGTPGNGAGGNSRRRSLQEIEKRRDERSRSRAERRGAGAR